MGIKTFLMDSIPGYNTITKPWHFLHAVVAATKNGFPGRRLTVIGVTGTNGKTSTSFMIWKMLNEAGHKTGVMTTVGWGVDKITPQVEHMTTESVGVLNRRMKAIAEAGCEFLVLEVTSHALSQFRILGVPIEVAVLTNVTHEHLDYHKTFENYRDAKRKLFKRAKFGVVNADDKSAAYFIADTLPKGYASKMKSRGYSARPDRFARREQEYYLTYGIERGILRAYDIESGVDGVSYRCGGGIEITRSERAVGVKDETNYAVSEMNIQSKIPGKFTVYNTLAAVAVGLRLGLTESEIKKGIAALTSVEGRMNKLDFGQKYDVIVDYAHTPDALLKVFEAVGAEDGSKRKKCASGSKTSANAGSNSKSKSNSSSTSAGLLPSGGRIISLHGGAGRRDESTRAERGEILARFSDIVVITEDDSRDEDPAEIAEMFVEGCEKAGKTRDKDLFVELDREKAIEKACSLARPGDLVLILGKGHEKTILRADGPHDFEDLKVTEKVIKKLLKH